MSEAVDAVTDYWFNTLGFPVLRAPKAVANAASRRISEKQGMRLVATKKSTVWQAGFRLSSGKSRRKNGAPIVSKPAVNVDLWSFFFLESTRVRISAHPVMHTDAV